MSQLFLLTILPNNDIFAITSQSISPKRYNDILFQPDIMLDAVRRISMTADYKADTLTCAV
jgi:hypothetical protein